MNAMRRTVKSRCPICDGVIDSLPVWEGFQAMLPCPHCATMVVVDTEDGCPDEKQEATCSHDLLWFHEYAENPDNRKPLTKAEWKRLAAFLRACILAFALK